jgi:hypothetical protein
VTTLQFVVPRHRVAVHPSSLRGRCSLRRG